MKCNVVSDLDDIDFSSVPTGVSNPRRQIIFFSSGGVKRICPE